MKTTLNNPQDIHFYTHYNDENTDYNTINDNKQYLAHLPFMTLLLKTIGMEKSQQYTHAIYKLTDTINASLYAVIFIIEVNGINRFFNYEYDSMTTLILTI